MLNYKISELIALVEANTNVNLFGLTFKQSDFLLSRMLHGNISRETANAIVADFIVENEMHRTLSFCHDWEKDESGNLTKEAEIYYRGEARIMVHQIIKDFWIDNLKRWVEKLD
jgi:hypothetical protein